MPINAVYTSPLGKIHISCSERGLSGLWFDGGRYEYSCIENLPDAESEKHLDKAILWLDTYFSGKDPGFTPKLYLHGTPFQMKVWGCLLEIPFGTTTTYKEIAMKLFAGKKNAAQAVGGAVKVNPVSLMIPCHRVIGADGSLTGYAGGLDRKRDLLKLEGIIIG